MNIKIVTIKGLGNMKKVIIILAIIFFIPSISLAWDDCPYGEVDEPYPGTCGRYTDTNHDKICDHSQGAPEDRNLVVSNVIPIKQDEVHKRIYHLPEITLFLLLLYVMSRILLKKNKLRLVNHKKIWNVLLLLTFLISGILGILLIIRINTGGNFSLPFNMLFWHVDVGIAMFVICVLHIIERWNYFKNILK